MLVDRAGGKRSGRRVQGTDMAPMPCGAGRALRSRDVRQGPERLLHRLAQLGRTGLLAPTAGRRARERADGVKLELANAVEVQRQRLGGLAE